MKNLTIICEAQVQLAKSADENQNPSGKIEARVTTWGAREGADGRKFNYKAEPFMEWAKAMEATGKPLPMYFQHNDESMPVGEWTSFEFDDKGMAGKGRLFTNTSAGRDLYTIMKESPNMVGGVSVGAYADEYCMVDAEGNMMDEPDDESYFQISKGGLREVSVVMYPNNPNAEVMNLECFDAEGHMNPRMVEKALREAGLSKKDATTASSILKKLLEQRDVAQPVLENVPTPSDTDAVDEASILAEFNTREMLKKLSLYVKE